MIDEEGVILICFRVEDLGEDHDPESFLDKCSSCQTEVFVAPRTLHDIADHHPGVTPLMVCTTCAPELMANTESEFANTPQQRKSWGEVIDVLRMLSDG